MKYLIGSILFIVAISNVYANGQSNTGKTYSFVVSDKDYSVIEIDGHTLKSADVDSKYCDLDVQRSLRIGKVFFKPITKKPFTLFITDKQGHTYPVFIKPSKKIMPNVYVIHPPKRQPILSDAERLQIKKVDYTISTNISRDKLVTQLISYMANKLAPNNVNVKENNEDMYLWEEVKFHKDYTYYMGSLKGEKYSIRNISKNTLVMIEKEFYPIKNNVLAVAIETPKLESGEETNVYIVTRKESKH